MPWSLNSSDILLRILLSYCYYNRVRRTIVNLAASCDQNEWIDLCFCTMKMDFVTIRPGCHVPWSTECCNFFVSPDADVQISHPFRDPEIAHAALPLLPARHAPCASTGCDSGLCPGGQPVAADGRRRGYMLTPWVGIANSADLMAECENCVWHRKLRG